MKKLLILVIAVLLQLASLQSQIAPPQAFSFKATIISKSGAIVASKPVSLRISILKNSIQGFAVYSEIFWVKTNEYGQVDLFIGKGNPVIGNFASIEWANDEYFLMTEVDIKGGTEFLPMSTVQLLSVPYSLLSDKSNHAFSADEKDPLFSAHPSNKISQGDISNWNEAASWGDHSLAGYATGDSVYKKSDLRIQGRSNVNWNNLGNRPDFATVATTGKYGDLQNLPVIPDNLNQLIPDAGNRTITNVSEPVYPSDASTKAYVDALLGRLAALEELAAALSNNTGDIALSTKDVTSITTVSAISGGSIVFEGSSPVTVRGLCWSTEANPTTANDTTNNGLGKGPFSASISGLEPGKTYHIRAYAVNSAGTAYGKERIFTTLLPPPVIKIDTVTSVTEGSAAIGGTISGSASAYEHGVCWNISPNPTTANNKIISNSDSGSYQVQLTGLSENTTYYARTYTIVPPDTIYGEEVSFTTPESLTGNVTDGEGNTYKYVKVGTQTWMAENLKATKYRNGDPIPNVTGPEWSTQTAGAYCWYNNDNANGNIYGALYNWYAVADSRKICPAGWHVPTNGEYTVLIMYLGGEQVAGGKLKEAGLSHWVTPNTGATNESGFTALPGGIKDLSGFSPAGRYGYLWTSLEFDSVSSGMIALGNSSSYAPINRMGKKYGLGVRCIKGDSAPVTLPVVSTNQVTGITSSGAISGGIVTGDGGLPVVARGVCWYGLANPTVSNPKTIDGGGTGEFTSTLTNLPAGRTFYLRAYATNAAGTAYGNEISFTTLPGLATVSSVGVTVTETSATLQSSVGYDGGSPVTERGFCWSDSINIPTINDLVVPAGSGTGTFSGTITGLEPGRLYWVRAYAKNGLGIAYGTPRSFQTKPPTIILWPENVLSLTSTSAEVHVNILRSEYPVVERGVCWSTSQNPTIQNNKMSSGTGIGRYFCNVTGLTPATSYYFKAYAINDKSEIVYGSEFTIITNPLLGVQTVLVDSITTSAATAYGKIEGTNGQAFEHGFCWSTSTNPTIENFRTFYYYTDSLLYKSRLNQLLPQTTYYVRAYVISGSEIKYGNELSFTTKPPGAPIAYITKIDSITAGTARVFSNVNGGGLSIRQRGVCLSTSQAPDTSDFKIKSSNIEGQLFILVSGLTPDTEYFVRAYAINGLGIGYSEVFSFRTSQLQSDAIIPEKKILSVPSYTAVKIENNAGDGSKLFESRNFLLIPDNRRRLYF